MRSSAVWLLVAGAAAACGGGVDSLAIDAPPVAVVQGRVDLSTAIPASLGRPLRAALVWGAVPNYVLACVRYPENAALQAVCPDPFGFVPGAIQAQTEVPLDGDGSFTLTLDQLPSAAVSVGDQSARIAWASLIVAADSDGDGSFNLLANSAGPLVFDAPPRLADVAVAASFFTLRAPHQRVGFREGGWDTASLFYPTPGCDAPMPGFSVLSAPGVGANPAEALPGTCSGSSLEVPVVAAALSAADARGLACRSLNRFSVRRPGDEPPGTQDGATLAGQQGCLDSQTLAFVAAGDCPGIVVFPLVGCRSNLVCQTPDWDLRQQPPSWWPCGS